MILVSFTLKKKKQKKKTKKKNFTLALSSSKGLRNSSQMESSRPSTQEQMLDHSVAHCTVSSEPSNTPPGGWEEKKEQICYSCSTVSGIYGSEQIESKGIARGQGLFTIARPPEL